MTETDARYRHASGEDPLYGCAACMEDEDDGSACVHPEPDPADHEVCRWCSHGLERVA